MMTNDRTHLHDELGEADFLRERNGDDYLGHVDEVTIVR
jgi:hypothetical protein